MWLKIYWLLVVIAFVIFVVALVLTYTTIMVKANTPPNRPSLCPPRLPFSRCNW